MPSAPQTNTPSILGARRESWCVLKAPRRVCHAFEAEVSCSSGGAPRMMGEGRFVRCQAAPRKAPSAQAVPGGGAERTRVCVSYFSSMEPRRVGVGLPGPRAQRLPLAQAVPRHCPAHPAQSELCPQLGPAPRPPTFRQGPHEAGTDRAFRMHACGG